MRSERRAVFDLARAVRPRAIAPPGRGSASFASPGRRPASGQPFNLPQLPTPVQRRQLLVVANADQVTVASHFLSVVSRARKVSPKGERKIKAAT
jgi:hypothetical protein